MKKHLYLGSILFSLTILVSGCTGDVFPRADWKKHKPAKEGVNTSALSGIDSLMQKAKSNGVLIRHGYLVAEWNYGGPKDKKFEVQSITKSITGLMLGIALMEAKIPAIDAKVKHHYPAFEVGPYTDEITFWHLVTASSGISAKRYRENYLDPANMPPGLESRYHNDHTAELAGALTYLYGEPLINVLKSRVLDNIGADAEWGYDGDSKVLCRDKTEVPVVAGYAFSKWTAADLARVGWLYANKGQWRGSQVLPRSYVEQSMKPISLPVMQFSRKGGSFTARSKNTYGLAWRGYFTRSGRLIWYMSGNGGQFCLVLPEEKIVFTKINGIGKSNQPFIGMDAFEDLVTSLVPERK